MKRIIVVLWMIIFIVEMVFAVNPQSLVGKTYIGEVTFDPESKSYALHTMVDCEIRITFKSVNKISATIRFIPKNSYVETLLSVNGAPSQGDSFDGTYKIKGDRLLMFLDGEIDTPTEMIIVRNGEAIIIDDDSKTGVTSILTPLKR